ncbi:MAG: PTS system mannose/fructose/sorbose family transporter subunit IID [Thermofilaceae archaeon]
MHEHGISVIRAILPLITCSTLIVVLGVLVQAGVIGSTPISLLELLGVSAVLLVATLTFLGCNAFGLTEPLIVGSVVGLILGIPHVALPLSALLELVYLGIVPIGGATAPNAVVAIIVALLFAKILGYTTLGVAELGTLMAIAIPVGVLTMYLETVSAGSWINVYSRWADKEIERGNTRKLGVIALLGSLQWFAIYMIPVLVIAALSMSSAILETLKAMLESPGLQRILLALGVGAILLPAAGLGLLLKLTYNPDTLPWFILGYVLVAYLKLPVLGVGLLVVSLTLVVHWRDLQEALQALSAVSSALQRGSSQVLTRSDLIKTYLKILFAGQWAWNYERMQGTAYAFIMNHVEKKLRKDREELKSWMSLHNEFFNTHPLMTAMIVGVNIAVEENGADQETVRSLKASLMGPLAGLGDSLVWYTWRPITFGIGSGLALVAGAVGPLMSFILWSPLVMLLGWYLLKLGYGCGLDVVSLIKGGRIEVIRRVASTVVIAMVATLGASCIAVSTPVRIAVPGSEPVDVQAVIDTVAPRLIPLVFLLGSFYMYRRGLSILKVLAVYFLVGAVLGFMGVLSVG